MKKGGWDMNANVLLNLLPLSEKISMHFFSWEWCHLLLYIRRGIVLNPL